MAATKMHELKVKRHENNDLYREDEMSCQCMCKVSIARES